MQKVRQVQNALGGLFFVIIYILNDKCSRY